MKTTPLFFNTRIVFIFIVVALAIKTNATEYLPGSSERIFNKIICATKQDTDSSGKKKYKKLTTGKKNAVSLFMNDDENSLKVIAGKNDKKQVDFFVFDLEGTLVHNYRMSANDEKKITGLQKGIYIYRVFCGDEETAAGKIEIN